MKDDFTIIDLDQTDTIPSGKVGEIIDNMQVPEEIFEGEALEEMSADEDYAEDGVFDAGFENAVKNQDAEEKMNTVSQENIINGKSIRGNYSGQIAADEDYGPDAEPILADVRIISDNKEDVTPLDIHSPEVFQGEVSMDTIFLKDLARDIARGEFTEMDQAPKYAGQDLEEMDTPGDDFAGEPILSEEADDPEDDYSENDESEEEFAEDEFGEDELAEDEFKEGESEEDEFEEGESEEDEFEEGESEEDEFEEGEFEEDESGEDEFEEGESGEDEFIEDEFEEDESGEDEAAYYDEDLEYIEENNPASARKTSDKAAAGGKKNSANKKRKKKKQKKTGDFEDEDGLFAILLNKIRDFTGFDWAIAGTGLVVFIVAIVVFVVFTGTRRDIAEASNVYNVGNQIAGLGIAGESGLMAVTDMAALKAIPSEEPEDTTEEISDTISENGIETKVTFTSVEQDLKIKFVNNETGRLITNVLFEVRLKDKKENETVLKDEDLDGIIYEKPMKSGEYTVELTEIPGYHFMKSDSTVTVKEKIVYEQIEIKEEIKTEAEINAAVEDTAVNAAEQEQKQEAASEENILADTVEWVESTRTPIEGSTGGNAEYNPIDKSTINEPVYTSSRALYIANEIYASAPMNPGMQRILTKASDVNVKLPVIYHTEDSDPFADPAVESSTEDLPAPIETEEPSASPVQEPSEIPTETPTAAPTETPTETPSQSPSETPTENPTVAPTETPTEAPSQAPSQSPSPSAQPSASPAPTSAPSAEPSAKISQVKLGESSMNLAPGASRAMIANAKMSDKSVLSDPEIFTYESEDTSIAKVDEKGVVTGVAEGKTKITVTYEDSYGTKKSATCKITVSSLTVKEVKFEKTELVLQDGLSEALSVTAVMSDGSKITDAAKFSWESSKDSVAAVKAGEVTAKDEGSATIKATFTDGAGNSKSAVCSVKVTKNAQSDTSSKLKDKNGNQVYVKDSSGNYVEAVYADYYTAGAFFQKVEVKYKYTGWQTLDGNVYFFDKNNNKVTGDQVIQGVKYHFTDDGILAMDKNGKLGIDVSKWNGNIDWNAVKNSGITYVIIRCGYRGSSTGVLVEDPTFKSNIKGATAAGLKVGVYFFTQAVNEVEAVEEASMCLSLVKGYGISYPIFIDTEKAGGRADGLDKNTRTAVCKAFCETIKNGGYTPGIYASKYWFYDNVNYNSLSSYRIWLAQYTSEPSFSHRYDLWQYSSKGSVSGIKGNVDMNWSYLGY